jgi:hypothetical protein
MDLISMTTSGGKARGSAASGLLFQSGQALFEETLAPLADNLAGGIETARDVVVGEPLGGVEDDSGTDNISIR